MKEEGVIADIILPNALNGVLGLSLSPSTIGDDGRSRCAKANEAGVGVADLERGGVTVHGPTVLVPVRRGRDGMERGIEIIERRFGLGALRSREELGDGKDGRGNTC